MRLGKIFVVALVALMVSSMGPAASAGANVDQCAPPGVESASALPTNLAAAAAGPGADKYTTATVEPVSAVNVNALGLSVPGTLTVGTLSDAPPSICINSARSEEHTSELQSRRDLVCRLLLEKKKHN